MYKVCPRCGRIHDINHQCYVGYNKRTSAPARFRASRAWRKKSQSIRDDAQGICEVCRDREIYTYKDLEVHHIIPLEEDISKGLDDDNLIALCSGCHKAAEQGLIKREYLQDLVAKREAR